jgi:hypothetical protein
LNIGEKVYCAGCTGLTTGAVIAIIGSFFYFIIGVPLIAAELVFWIGFGGVMIGIVQHNIYRVLGNPGGVFRCSLLGLINWQATSLRIHTSFLLCCSGFTQG